MKKNILLLLLSHLLFMSVDAQAQEWCEDDPCNYEDSSSAHETNFYAKISGGANFLQNTSNDGNEASYKTGYIVAGSLGYCWRYGLRLEAEYAFRKNSIRNIDFFVEGSSTNGRCETSSYMVNLLWDFPLSTWGCSFWDIQPYLGAGIGYDFQQMHSSNSRVVFNQKWKRFSWQIMTGLAYPIFCNTEMTLEYKFHQGRCHFYNHSIGVGLAYKFGF